MKNDLFGIVLICEYVQIISALIEIRRQKITEKEANLILFCSVIFSIMNITGVSAAYYTRWFSAFAILAVICYAFIFVRVLRWKKTNVSEGKKDKAL